MARAHGLAGDRRLTRPACIPRGRGTKDDAADGGQPSSPTSEFPARVAPAVPSKGLRERNGRFHPALTKSFVAMVTSPDCPTSLQRGWVDTSATARLRLVRTKESLDTPKREPMLLWFLVYLSGQLGADGTA